MAEAALELVGVDAFYGEVQALRGFGLTLMKGEVLCLLGRNGAGKTTALRAIMGLVTIRAGTILKDGKDLTRMAPSTRARQGIGRAFQLTNLFPELSVLENIRLAVQARAGYGWRFFRPVKGFHHLTEAAERTLEATRLTRLAHQPAASLPHGDQRKLEVALLMAMEPDIYMFDEPTAGMSLDHAPDVLDLIATIKTDPTKTVLLVEHKMDVIRALADRIIVLHNGELLADGPPAEIMQSQVVRDVYLGTSTEETA